MRRYPEHTVNTNVNIRVMEKSMLPYANFKYCNFENPVSRLCNDMIKYGVKVKPNHHYIVVLTEGVTNQQYNYNYKVDRWQEVTLHKNEHDKHICRVVSRTGNIKAYFTRDDVHTLLYSDTKYNTLAELFITEQSPIIQTMHFVITHQQNHAYIHTTQSFCIDFIDKFKTKNIHMIVDSTDREKEVQDNHQERITREMCSTREADMVWNQLKGHECQICRGSFERNDKIYFCSLTHKHPFHANCALKWSEDCNDRKCALKCPSCMLQCKKYNITCQPITTWIKPGSEDFEKISKETINTGKSMANPYTLSLF